jgi:heme exporter protein CcmD
MNWFYVWIAYLVTVIAMAAEVLLLLRRRRAVRHGSDLATDLDAGAEV